MIFHSKAKAAERAAEAESAPRPERLAEVVARAPAAVRHSIIPVGMQVTGDLISSGDINVEGSIQGNITCRTLTLEGQPLITGSVKAETIRICGSFTGDVEARKVALTKTAKVNGEIAYHTLEIEPGASYEGKLQPLEGAGREA